MSAQRKACGFVHADIDLQTAHIGLNVHALLHHGRDAAVLVGEHDASGRLPNAGHHVGHAEAASVDVDGAASSANAAFANAAGATCCSVGSAVACAAGAACAATACTAVAGSVVAVGGAAVAGAAVGGTTALTACSNAGRACTGTAIAEGGAARTSGAAGTAEATIGSRTTLVAGR